MGIPVQYDEFGRPVSPRWAQAAKPDFPRIHKPKKREGTWTTTCRVKRWLANFRKDFTAFAEEMGCEADSLLLVMAGFISQDIQILSDAMQRSTRWIRPRAARLRKMEMWVGGTELGPRFGAWYEALTDDDRSRDAEFAIRMLLDAMEIDGQMESTHDESGELLFRMREAAKVRQ